MDKAFGNRDESLIWEQNKAGCICKDKTKTKLQLLCTALDLRTTCDVVRKRVKLNWCLGKMDLFGNFGRFDTSIEWLKQYIIANDICDEKKMAVLLSIMGTEAYNLLCNLTAPIIPADSKACAKIVWILQSPQLTDTVWPQSFFTFTDMIKGRGGGTRTPPNLNKWLE